jgi:hypothetical protein
MFRSLIVSQPSFGISYVVSTIKVKYHTVLMSSCKVLLFLFNFNQNGNESIVAELQNIKFHKNPLVKTQQQLPPARWIVPPVCKHHEAYSWWPTVLQTIRLWKTNKLQLIRVYRFWRLTSLKNWWKKTNFKKSHFNLQWTLDPVIKRWEFKDRSCSWASPHLQYENGDLASREISNEPQGHLSGRVLGMLQDGLLHFYCN